MGIFSKLFGGGEPADPDKNTHATSTSSTGGRRILLVEQSLTVKKVMELTLQNDHITQADDAADARAKAAGGVFDAAIVNGSTVDDAYNLCAELKQRMPVIILAATFFPFDDEAARRAGVDAILKVPFNPKELEAELSRVASRFH